MANRSTALSRRDQLRVVGTLRNAMQQSARHALMRSQSEARRADATAADAKAARIEAVDIWQGALASRSPDPRFITALAFDVVAKDQLHQRAADDAKDAADRVVAADVEWARAQAAEQAGEKALHYAQSRLACVEDERAAVVREEMALREYRRTA